MLLHVEVTQDDCRAGVRGSHAGCPVAMALSRALGRPVWVSSWQWHMPTHNTADWREGHLPPEAGRAADAFDATGAMSPFAFDLDVPEEE